MARFPDFKTNQLDEVPPLQPIELATGSVENAQMRCELSNFINVFTSLAIKNTFNTTQMGASNRMVTKGDPKN